MDFFEKNNMDSDTDDEQEDKNVLRQDVSYMIQKIAKVYGFMRVFKVLAERLNVTLHQLQSQADTDNSKSLSKFEAELYCLSGALKYINPEDPDTFTNMQKMLELILSLKYQKQKVLYTALKIITRSSHFFGTRSDLLQSAFKLLAECVHVKKFENEAAEAISNLCKNNKSFVIDNLEDFVACNVLITQFTTKSAKKTISCLESWQSSMDFPTRT